MVVMGVGVTTIAWRWLSRSWGDNHRLAMVVTRCRSVGSPQWLELDPRWRRLATFSRLRISPAASTRLRSSLENGR
eukprot:3311549-Pyramimonas_sp.AAC.1